MKIGIMQPYFMPYLGYISLIMHTERFILLDEVQFIKHGWIERNRIMKPSGGWQYIAVPLKKYHRETLIKDIRINNDLKWKDKIFAQLVHYKKAPYFRQVNDLLNDIFQYEYESIVALNKRSLELTCKYLGFERKIEIFSDMNLNIDEVTAPDEWALNICKAIDGVDEYWNPVGGMSFFDESKYTANNVDVKFHSIILEEYNQKRQPFESGLSIIDVMMFNSTEKIEKMLGQYTLITKT